MKRLCTSDNIVLAGFDLTPATGPIIPSAACPQIMGQAERMLRATDQAFKAAEDKPSFSEALQPKPAPKAPLWWTVTITKHSDAVVIRSVTGRRPTVTEIKKHGWHEIHDDGDEHYVHPDAIAEIAITGGFYTPPTDAISAHLVNAQRGGRA